MNILITSVNLQLKYFLSVTYVLKEKGLAGKFFFSKKGFLEQQILAIKKLFFKKFSGGVLNSAKGCLSNLTDAYSVSSLRKLTQKNTTFDFSIVMSSFLPSLHPITTVVFKLISFFKKLGFTFEFGYEVESEDNCFSLLNMSACHTARDPKNSFYLQNKYFSQGPGSRLLLRTQTSTVQIKAMSDHKPPMRKISFGRVFRNDNVDLTHNTNFHQLEGLYIDDFKNVSVAELKYVLTSLLKNLLGREVRFRFRNSFFPFTVPSFEIDVLETKTGS